jgi:hypothetical protein
MHALISDGYHCPGYPRVNHLWRRWVSSVVLFTFSNLLNHNRLDLTAGSRAYILEPQWNPMVEEQALCRVHRVGQKREVTTVRYLIRGSFEEVRHLHLM